MSHRITVSVSDEEYATLSTEATKRRKTIASLLREAALDHVRAAGASNAELRPPELHEYLYRAGVIEHVPAGEPDTPEEAEERERLATIFGRGRPVSDIVIEDRGPR